MQLLLNYLKDFGPTSHRKDTICRCAWRNINIVRHHQGEIIGLWLFPEFFPDSLGKNNLISATPLKLLEGFWCNCIQRKDTICRCAWRNINIVWHHQGEIIWLWISPDSLGKDSLVSATLLKLLERFWCNFTQRKDTSCRCAWSNIIIVWSH